MWSHNQESNSNVRKSLLLNKINELVGDNNTAENWMRAEEMYGRSRGA